MAVTLLLYPKNGDLWFDSRQGRLFIWLDDGYYQTNGADGHAQQSQRQFNRSKEVPGALWLQHHVTNALYIYDGTGWEQLTCSVYWFQH